MSQIDHLVIAANTLEEGVAWCESTLGITPGPGGEHPLMGSHNRLFSIASTNYPTAYFEIIAINKEAEKRGYGAGIQDKKRWFDFDNEVLQLRLKKNGPQLIHFVASTPEALPAIKKLASLGIDRGGLLTASRMTPQGLLSWKITVRADGQRLMHGTLPTLIEWGDIHPADHLVASGVILQSLTASLPNTSQLRAACDAIDLQGFTVMEGPPNLIATLQTPRGLVALESKGL